MADTQQASSSNTAPTAVPLTYSDKSLFDQAREHETKDEYNEAADLYSELLEKRSKEFGETSKQCAEPALCFARCLLRAAQARGDDLIAMRIAKTKPHFDNGEGNEAPKVANEGEEEAEEEEESVEQMLDTAVSVCELSKRSFSQLLQEASSESEMKLYSEKLADAHCIFGEVAGEVDNFEVALSEYKLALALVTFNAQLASSMYVFVVLLFYIFFSQVSMAATHVCMGDLKEALLCYQKAIEALSSYKSKQELSIDMYKSIIVDVNERVCATSK